MRANLADLVRGAAARRPVHPALVSEAATWTWADLDAAVDAVAAALRARGLSAGDRVALVLGNSLEFAAAYFGVLRAGLVAVPINPTLTEYELHALLADSDPRLGIVGDAVRPGVAGAAPDLDLVVVGGTGPESYDAFVASGSGRAGAAEGATEVDTDADDLALLLFTSGTSGQAKGAMLTHRALLANVESVASTRYPSVQTDDVVLLVLPMFHVYSLNGTLAAVAHQAATVVIVERFDPEGSLDLIQRHGVTNIPGAPPMFVAWSTRPRLGEAFANVRILFTGAAPMPAEVSERILEATGLPVFEGYGLTEAAPGVTSTLVGGVAKPGSVGQPLPGVQLRLLTEEGEEVEEGDPGEIWIHGDNVFSGYWPDGEGGPDADGWFATGDVGYLDDDGDLVLVDRRKELVIVNGFNVYPREVEDALVAHPDVAEVAVIGIPDERTGESVKAYVVPAPGADLDEAAVSDYAATRLARFKRPTTFVVVDALPHSATGKVAKGRLREDSALA